MTASTEPTKKKPKESLQEEEFVDVSPPQRNWKGIAISLLVIVGVCSLISMSVVLLSPVEVQGTRRSRATVSDLYSPEFVVHDPTTSWFGDAEVVFRDNGGHVVKFNFVLNETEVLIRNKTFVDFKAVKYSLSPDLKFALVAYDVNQVYRYSYTASYIMYNLHTREVWEVSPPEVQNAVLQHAAWGRRAQQLLYVFENNIYYQSDMRGSSFRVTSSGTKVIFNGIADWLYEEEILKSNLAYWWSPDGDRLAFLTINDTMVPSMALPQFTGSTYPRGLHYPYPMAGQVNPSVRLSVVSLFGSNIHTQELLPPERFRMRDLYVAMVKWISSTHLAVRWLKRSQNSSMLAVCDTTTGSCVERHQETSEAWLTMQDREPWFSKDRSRLFLTLPVKQGGQGDFQHISMLIKKLRSDENEVRHITSGDWEVTRILAYDESNQIIYFLSTEDSPQHRHMYSVSTLGLFPRRCLTCGLRRGCTFFDADVSPDSQHAILRCKGPGVPSVLLLNFDNIPSYYVLEDNRPLRSALESRQSVQSETTMILHDHSVTAPPGIRACPMSSDWASIGCWRPPSRLSWRGWTAGGQGSEVEDFCIRSIRSWEQWMYRTSWLH